MMTHWPSPAKLNLFLYITGQRADGYHTLQTLFQFVDYGDTISIEPRQDGQICLLTPVDGVAHDDNLIVRAARLLMKTASTSGRLPGGKRCGYPYRQTPADGRRSWRRLIKRRDCTGGA